LNECTSFRKFFHQNNKLSQNYDPNPIGGHKLMEDRPIQAYSQKSMSKDFLQMNRRKNPAAERTKIYVNFKIFEMKVENRT